MPVDIHALATQETAACQGIPIGVGTKRTPSSVDLGGGHLAKATEAMRKSTHRLHAKMLEGIAGQDERIPHSRDKEPRSEMDDLGGYSEVLYAEWHGPAISSLPFGRLIAIAAAAPLFYLTYYART